VDQMRVEAPLQRWVDLGEEPADTVARGRDLADNVIVAIILLLVGGFIQALQFLLWVGAVLLVIAVIAWAIRSLSGRSR